MAPSAEHVTATQVLNNNNNNHDKQEKQHNRNRSRAVVFSTSWSQSMTALSIILSELILLIIKLLYSALESILLTLIPPSEKSLEGEIILGGYGMCYLSYSPSMVFCNADIVIGFT
ncbi:hypothetical protein M8J77_000090 [Diaphorina citri]|nr:hypothetical protein M8J77_000090 [Diaphorina citri]